MPFHGLTERQRAILDFVGAFIAERGYSPTLRDICERFGYTSTTTASKHVIHLVKKGKLRMARYQKRGLSIPDSSEELLREASGALAGLADEVEFLDGQRTPDGLPLVVRQSVIRARALAQRIASQVAHKESA